MFCFSTFYLVWFAYLIFSICIRTTTSQVPLLSLYYVHATFSPDATQTALRYLLDSSPKFSGLNFVSTSDKYLDVLTWRFTFVHLHNTHMTSSSLPFPLRSVPWLFTIAPKGCLKPLPFSDFGVPNISPSKQQLLGTRPDNSSETCYELQ